MRRKFKISSLSKLNLAMVVLLIIGVGAVVYGASGGRLDPRASAIAECTGGNANDFKCWRDRYQQMVAQQSPKEALADAKGQYEKNEYIKVNCHQIAHVIGRAGGNKYKEVELAYAQGNDFCWSGYYHGVMEALAAKMGAAKVVGKINSICSSFNGEERYKFSHYNCVHGLGHGLMAVQSNNLFQSLNSCDGLADSWEQESCYGGVFMENVMSEMNPDHHTEYLKRDDLMYPCTAVDDRYKNQCYLMQTSYVLKEVGHKFEEVFDLCDEVNETYRHTCYVSIGRDASSQTISDGAKTKDKCMLGASAQARSGCIEGAAKDFVSYFHDDKQALAFCSTLGNGLQSECRQTVSEYFSAF